MASCLSGRDASAPADAARGAETSVEAAPAPGTATRLLGGAALLLLDRRDQLALAHAGRARDAHLLRNLLQLGQQQRGKTSPLAAAPLGRRGTVRPGWRPGPGVGTLRVGVPRGRRTTEGGFPGRIRAPLRNSVVSLTNGPSITILGRSYGRLAGRRDLAVLRRRFALSLICVIALALGMFLHEMCCAPAAERNKPGANSRGHPREFPDPARLPTRPPPETGRERKDLSDALPGGHCLTTAAEAARSHVADEHPPRIGAPGATPSLTPREPTAFPHRYPCVAKRGRPACTGWISCPAADGARSRGVFTAVCRLREPSLALRTGS